MNFGGRGFPSPQDNGIGQNRDSWTPVTPGKPIPQRSDMIPVDMQGNHVGRENWNDLLGVYSDILEAPDLNVAAGHISNPFGPMGTNGGNRNSNLVLSQNGGVRNGNLVSSQNGGIQNFNVVFGQNGGGVWNGSVGTGQNGGVRNVNVGMGHNGGVRNVSLGMGQDGGVQNMHAGMVPNGGNQSRNVGAGQNAQIHDWNVGLGQNEGNHNLNMGTGRIGGNRNLNMATSQNGGTHNLNVGMGQTGVNRNWKVVQSQNGGNKTQGIPSQNGYSSSYTTGNLPNDPSNWSPGLMAALLKAKNQAAASGEARNRLTQTSFQVQSRPVIPRSELSSSVLREQDQTFSSSQEVREYNLQQLPIDGFPDTYRPTYNLNSPPRAEAEATSSVANFFQLEPVTPDMRKLQENHNVPQEVNCSVYGSSSQEKDGILTSENNENQCNELLQSIVNSSSSAVSTTPILDAFEEGHERGIDLNKTPQQKTPKKKKHRPKVVREGKPKKTPKPKAPEKGVPNETPSGKRKYARKNGLKISESQQPNDVGQVCAESPQCVTKRKYVRKNSLKTPESQQESAVDYVKVPAAESTTKSCRRALSFDLESTQNDENQVERNQGSVVGFNLNINPQDAEMCTGINSISKASAVQLEGHNGYIAGPKDQQTSTCQMLLGNSSSPEATAPTTPLPKMKAHNLNAIARNVTMRNSIPGQNAQLNRYSQVDRHASGGLGQTAFNTDAGCTDLERGREQMLQRPSQMFMEDMPSVDGKRGLKRQSFEQINPRTINNMHPPFMYQKMLREAIGSSNGSDHFDSSYLESNKKKKMQDGVYSNISTAPSGITAVNDSPRQERRGINGVQANRSVSQLLNTYFRGEKATDKVTNAVNLATGNSFFHPMSANQNLQKRHVGSELQSCAERLAMKKSQELNRVHDFNPFTAIVACNQLPTTPPKDTARSDYLQEMMARNAYLLKQQQTLKQSSSNRWLHVSDQILQQEYNNAVEGRRHLPTAPKETPRSDYLQDIRTSQANVLEQKQCQNPGSGNRKGINKMLQQQQKYVAEGHQSSTKARGMPTKQYYLGLVDEITYRLKGLNIGGDRKHQHALVPYNADNSIVLFEPKKRKPRPRVDLDPETDRLWKLLMGKEGCGGAEAMDKDKEKWWEEERAVFRGRADSFIARMHLVQGDRRFSRWKGSVVDSVIGVFLTQNVSDHLSSSAFMSLAAKFPPNPTATNEAYCQSGIQVVVEEPDIQILEQNGSIKYNEEIGRQPQYNHNLMIACESTENKRHLSSGVSDAVNKHNRLTEEELVSQDSFDSLVFQTADEQRSSSGSNSEAEDQTTGSKPINPGSTLMNLLNSERGNLIEEFYNHLNGSTMLEVRTTNMRCQLENQECDRQNLRYVGGNNLKSSPEFSSSINSNIHHMQELVDSPNPFQLRMKLDSQKLGVHFGAMSAEETLSSLPSTASGVTDAYHTNNRTYHQSEMQTPRAQTFVKYGYLSKHPTHQGAFQPGHQIGSVPNSMNNQQPQNSNTHQVERAFMRGPIDPAETLTKMESARKQGFINPKFRETNVNTEDRMSVVDKQNCIENTAVEANSKEQTCSSRDPLGGTATNNVNTKKGKAEDEKKGAFDWDSLRKQVLLNGGKKERSKDAVDSLNYEALRTTDVKNISDAIRERGMNNMLADRIQDFLNRLVRDHESIDLEWLRDVPPDRAKDYLLSFRGLGLKSVECVRLLTLHHLAFPVDTNVGRIAVRLGWVPLQPLPESLQLHLLEMYPVLESIQKYLWPRLCKLDQPTLYELHYQMITFGKVFCTKSKPNCNACPMRAECRHFASAFASARFALPGPEEKRMVSSAIPIVDDIKPKEAINPLSLPPAENSSHKDSGFFDRKCVSIIEEPIIEYPSSPHSETTEISERDIEDAFYEDPDDIPTIRLNMEEFTTNLQNLMQDNMELQGDMSKALVALNPEAASIPTAKLKNVSRLRTEHRVYELPDSHPLLDGLDKREPDDPSPYLLAIWTPGETANSVQPPESTCSAQESGNLCDDNTCFSCNSTREANSQTVRGTILVPCRTAMRGSFPLNGTYFQVNEMFADHESSLRPIDVPRTWLWNLPRRTVFFGTSVSTIFKGLTTEEIQFCFWRGFVCVRGFDQKSRAPRPLMARLHFPASKLVKKKDEKK